MRIIINASLLLLLCLSFASAKSRTTFTGVRAMGMGNATVANVDDASSMLANPAGLDLYQEHMHLTMNFAAYVSPSIIDLSTFVANQSDKLTNTEGLKTLDNKFYDALYKIDGTWSTVGLLPNVGFMARTLGLTYGAYYYWNIPTRVMMESGVLVPKIFLGTQMDQVLTGAVARRFNKNMSIGAAVKMIDRYIVDDIALGYTQTMEFIERFNKAPMSAIDPLLTHQYGAGLDLGGIGHFGAFRAGMSVLDLASYIGDEFITPRLNIGMAYKILPLMENRLIDDATATIDLHDVFRRANFFTKLNIGAEVRMYNLDVRVGINQGYPTLGTTLHWMIFHLDYLYYGEELGLYPGDRPLLYHLIQMGADIKF